MVAHALRRQGADVTTVTVYRVAGADDPEPMFKLIDLIADRALDAVTFTSAPAVAALMDAAGSDRPARRRDRRLPGRRGRVLRRAGDRRGLRDVGRARRSSPTGPGWPRWSSSSRPSCPRARRDRRSRSAGHQLLLHGDDVLLDGVEVKLSPAPPPSSRRWSPTPATWSPAAPCWPMLPRGTAGSEHAVEMAVARLRAALGTRAGADRRQARLPAGGGHCLSLATASRTTQTARALRPVGSWPVDRVWLDIGPTGIVLTVASERREATMGRSGSMARARDWSNLPLLLTVRLATKRRSRSARLGAG